MIKDKYIRVGDKNYVLLGMHGGVASLGLLYDLNNDIYWRNVIWQMKGGWDDKGKFYTWRMNLTRGIMRWFTKSKDWSKSVNNAYKLACIIHGKEKIDRITKLPCDK